MREPPPVFHGKPGEHLAKEPYAPRRPALEHLRVDADRVGPARDIGALTIMAGEADIVVAGGMESMSNAPYLLDKARTGYRMGDGKIVDSMVKDGLWDVYNEFHMGNAAELCSRECNISREAQDEYAAMSYRRTLEAMDKGYFKSEIVPVPVKAKDGTTLLVEEDEEPRKVKIQKIPQLKPASEKMGQAPAANASKLNDGASAVAELRARPMIDRPVRKWERNSMMYSFSCFTTAALWTVSTG